MLMLMLELIAMQIINYNYEIWMFLIEFCIYISWNARRLNIVSRLELNSLVYNNWLIIKQSFT